MEPMKAPVDLPDNQPYSHPSLNGSDERRRIVLQELEKILLSSFFRSAARSKQFLQYVIEHQLEGHPELLKERTIGTEVFLRPPGYATGDDPVVRVQAGEVRRRLESYYQATADDPPVRIELPVGSYSPVFHWRSDAAPSSVPIPPLHSQASEPRKNDDGHLRVRLLFGLGFVVALVLGAGLAQWIGRPAARQKSTFDQFWEPVFSTQQPALICLAKGVSYRPSPEVYQKYARSHPGTYQTEVERSSIPLPLDANEKLSWSELPIYDDYGVATGDVSAAVKLSAVLGNIGKPSQVRIGANYSFEDLRNSPAIVIGAFNNKWTMQLTSNLHFAFVEEDGQFKIREQIPGGRVWLANTSGRGIPVEDFAVVARLLDSKTGQFTIIAAGITGSGTQAAGEFASNPKLIERSLRNAPPSWQAANLEVVLETTLTDSTPGPPQVVATYFW